MPRLAMVASAARRIADEVTRLLPSAPGTVEAPPERRPGPDEPDPAALRRVDEARKDGHGGPG